MNELTGNGKVFWNLKDQFRHPLGHASSNKATHTNSFQTVLPTAEQVSIYLSLWGAILIQTTTSNNKL